MSRRSGGRGTDDGPRTRTRCPRDTVVFIYFIEEDPRFLPLVEPVFAAVDSGRWEAVTSALTLLETLIVPYRTGNASLADRYEALLTRSRGIRLVTSSTPCFGPPPTSGPSLR